MPINIGYVEMYALQGDGEIRVTLQYDNTLPASEAQPLIDDGTLGGPCLRVRNTTPRVVEVTITNPVNGSVQTFNANPGAQDFTRTANQLASRSILTRGHVGQITWRQLGG